MARTLSITGHASGALWWPMGAEFVAPIAYRATLDNDHGSLRDHVAAAIAPAEADSSGPVLLDPGARIVVEEHRPRTPLAGGGYRGGLVAIRAYDADEFPSIADYIAPEPVLWPDDEF